MGLAGLLGSGRTETAKAIYGAQALDGGRSKSAVMPSGSAARAAIAAGIALIPEDRKANGIVRAVRWDNIVLAALPTLSRRASSRIGDRTPRRRS